MRFGARVAAAMVKLGVGECGLFGCCVIGLVI